MQTTRTRLAGSSVSFVQQVLKSNTTFHVPKSTFWRFTISLPRIQTAKTRLRQILKHLPIWVIQYKIEYHIPTKDLSENRQKIAHVNIIFVVNFQQEVAYLNLFLFPIKQISVVIFHVLHPIQAHKLFHMTAIDILFISGPRLRAFVLLSRYFDVSAQMTFMIQGHISNNLLVSGRILYFFEIYMNW